MDSLSTTYLMWGFVMHRNGFLMFGTFCFLLAGNRQIRWTSLGGGRREVSLLCENLSWGKAWSCRDLVLKRRGTQIYESQMSSGQIMFWWEIGLLHFSVLLKHGKHLNRKFKCEENYMRHARRRKVVVQSFQIFFFLKQAVTAFDARTRWRYQLWNICRHLSASTAILRRPAFQLWAKSAKQEVPDGNPDGRTISSLAQWVGGWGGGLASGWGVWPSG